MSSLNQNAPRSSGPNVVGFVGGLMIGLVTLCIGGALGYSFVRKAHADARKGWNLVPVVVAAVDLPEDTVVTMEMISQRSIPEQFVTSSVVKPDSASYIVNQKVLVAVQAGDPLLWSQFATKKQATVLFAVHDVAVGAALSESDVEERGVEEALMTRSWVRTEDRPQTLGRPLIAPFRKGDPILWTHFDATKK